MRLFALQRPGSTRRSSEASDVVLELDRWQVTGLLAALCVFCAGAFAAGLAVGKDSRRDSAASTSLDLRAQPGGSADTRDRQLSLAEVSPSTDRLSLDLARPVADPVSSNPAEKARIATHRALQEARATGLRQVDPADTPELALPILGQAAPIEGEGEPAAAAETAHAAHALAVTTFANEPSAIAMRDALSKMVKAPHETRVRRIISQGQVAWRVEVGRFTNFKEATAFQREFQTDSGYLVGLVAIP